MSFVGQSRGIDDGRSDIVWRSQRRWQRYLGKYRLDFGSDENILDKRSDDGALADSLVTTNTDSDWGTILVNSRNINNNKQLGQRAPHTGRHISAYLQLTAYQ